MKRFLPLFIGFLILIGTEILRVYFIMPFPGSQQSNTIRFAYALDRNIWWFRILGIILIAYPLYLTFRSGKWWKVTLLSIVLLLWIGIFWLFNFKFLAEKMFYQPKNKMLVSITDSKVPDNRLVIGVALNGEARAYPIEIIGYHHQVRDTVGGVPVMVTYCTVCRTGRVYSPMVNGKPENFRLVGMDHFNAMFEDASTKSWWQQATGKAVAGPLLGTALEEIPSEQMRLGSWLSKYPSSLILQQDSFFRSRYEGLENYDIGTIDGSLEKRDSNSWKMKSWVLGVKSGDHRRAYDWNDVAMKRVIQDTFYGEPIVIYVEPDTVSFHVWKRTLQGQVLNFEQDSSGTGLRDGNTGSLWNQKGECTEGVLKGNKLEKIPAYQEFWHSWKQFQPYTSAPGFDTTKLN